MAIFHVNFYSEMLKLNTDLNVIIPTPNSDEKVNGKDTSYFDDNRVFQVLYLLHGTFGDYSDWMRLTSIERYAQDAKLAVVMPSCANSFYHDMVSGPRYLTFLTEELPDFICKMFPISDHRKDTFVAGLSMGGYGAWHVAFSKPERFSAAISLSGGMDISTLTGTEFEKYPWPIKAIFGDMTPTQIAESKANIEIEIASLLNTGVTLPKLFMSVGTEDFTYEGNQKLREFLVSHGIEHTYEEHPGIHDWLYWDTHIQRAIRWLPRAENTVLKD